MPPSVHEAKDSHQIRSAKTLELTPQSYGVHCKKFTPKFRKYVSGVELDHAQSGSVQLALVCLILVHILIKQTECMNELQAV